MSIVQQLINDGNILNRSLNTSPTGDMANTTCKLVRTLSIKKLNSGNGELSILLPIALAVRCMTP